MSNRRCLHWSSGSVWNRLTRVLESVCVCLESAGAAWLSQLYARVALMRPLSTPSRRTNGGGVPRSCSSVSRDVIQEVTRIHPRPAADHLFGDYVISFRRFLRLRPEFLQQLGPPHSGRTSSVFRYFNPRNFSHKPSLDVSKE